MFASLPPASFAAFETRRLRAPVLVWPHADAAAGWFDPAQAYCRPQAGDAPRAYAGETRLEFAGREDAACSTPDAVLETKHAWAAASPTPTPSSPAGPRLLAEALIEAVYAQVFARHLPFGAVPVLAVIAIDDPGPGRPCGRGLAMRPFVPQPRHFMREPGPAPGRGPGAAGWSADALRTRSAQAVLAAHLAAALDLPAHERDEWALIDAGLRELARRVAAQAAAGLCKGLLHGRLADAPFDLGGAMLDFDHATHVPAWRRRRATPAAADPWDDARAGANALATLRAQVARYHARYAPDTALVAAEALRTLHGRQLDARMAIELAKMGGLTEDLATACPPALLDAWLQAARTIWTRGAERHVAPPGGEGVQRACAPAPRCEGRFDLNAILSAAAQAGDGAAMDRRLAPLLDDAALRTCFVRAAMAVRCWLRSQGPSDAAADRYLALQARRKNAGLDVLRRDGPELHGTLHALAQHSDFAGLRRAVDRALAAADHVLCDLAPGLPGATGAQQLRHAAALGATPAGAEP